MVESLTLAEPDTPLAFKGIIAENRGPGRYCSTRSRHGAPGGKMRQLPTWNFLVVLRLGQRPYGKESLINLYFSSLRLNRTQSLTSLDVLDHTFI